MSTTPHDTRQDSFDHDLNPNNPLDGQNAGTASNLDEAAAPHAYDIKEFHDAFPTLSSDELKSIPVLPVGSRLEQGATYLDLRDPERTEVHGRSEMVAGEGNWYVPKKDVDYELYNRLRGVQHPGSENPA